MNQVFMERFLGCGLNREKLLAFMADIDAEKRALKSFNSRDIALAKSIKWRDSILSNSMEITLVLSRRLRP